MDLVCGGTEDGRVDCEREEGDAEGVEEEVKDWHALDGCVGVVDVEV